MQDEFPPKCRPAWSDGRNRGRTDRDVEDYKRFEASIVLDYDAQSAVERELVLRLASLLWRLRRATAIETRLFELVSEGPHESEPARNEGASLAHPAIKGSRAASCGWCA
jgi:hypothetical protein